METPTDPPAFGWRRRQASTWVGWPVCGVPWVEEDVADVFFLGKTPDFARMQFDLTALEGSGATAIVTAKNGEEIVRHQIAAADR